MVEQRGSNNRWNWEVAGFEPKKSVEQRDDYRKPTVGRRYSMSISSYSELSKHVVSSNLLRLNDKVKMEQPLTSLAFRGCQVPYWKQLLKPKIRRNYWKDALVLEGFHGQPMTNTIPAAPYPLAIRPRVRAR